MLFCGVHQPIQLVGCVADFSHARLALCAATVLHWLALIAVWAQRRQPGRSGDLFRGFMTLYLGFRLLVETIKPGPGEYLGLSGIQVACLLGLLYYARHVPRVFSREARWSTA